MQRIGEIESTPHPHNGLRDRSGSLDEHMLDLQQIGHDVCDPAGRLLVHVAEHPLQFQDDRRRNEKRLGAREKETRSSLLFQRNRVCVALFDQGSNEHVGVERDHFFNAPRFVIRFAASRPLI